MHPAPSIILFTVLSGFGFGLISILGLLQFLNAISVFDLIIFSVSGVVFSTVGLMSSFFHLANKINAIKSLSQWQTSWLSREAIASIFCLLLVLGNIGWGFFQNMYIKEVGLILMFPDEFKASILIVFLHLVGIYFSRWLFFAEAKHSVSFYYE